MNADVRWEIPSGLIVSSQAGCAADAGDWLCELGTLPAGAEIPVTLDFTPTVAGNFQLSVAIEGDRLDLNSENDRVTISLKVTPDERLRNLFLPLIGQGSVEPRARPEAEIHLPVITGD